MSLKQHIINRIETEGALSVASFMNECLYNEDYGYYMTRDPLGAEGDFTTAPEITQMFGEIVGAWVADTWLKMGSPESWNLIEVGPGRGTLMADMLRTLETAAHQAYESANITLVELSPVLKLSQRKTLEEHPQIRWAATIDDVDFTNPTILIGNEILDAFPARQLMRKETGYHERLVEFKNNQFTFTLSPEPVATPIESENAPIIEVQDAMESFLCKLKDKMKNGVALFIDYGDEGYGDTLQAVQNHNKVDLFHDIGNSDITTHVNFTNVRKIMGLHNTSQVEPMGTFLTSLGFAARAAFLLQAATKQEEKQAIEQAAHRLLHPEQMGELFKVIAYQTGNWPLAGLAFLQQAEQQDDASILKNGTNS